MMYCKESGARLNPRKRKTITAAPLQSLPTYSANNIDVLAPSIGVKLYEAPTGTAIDSVEQKQEMLQRNFRRCMEFENQEPTLQGRAFMLFSRILSVTWYVINDVHTISAKTQCLQNVASSFDQRMKLLPLGHKSSRKTGQGSGYIGRRNRAAYA